VAARPCLRRFLAAEVRSSYEPPVLPLVVIRAGRGPFALVRYSLVPVLEPRLGRGAAGPPMGSPTERTVALLGIQTKQNRLTASPRREMWLMRWASLGLDLAAAFPGGHQ